MTEITVSELQANTGKYVAMSRDEYVAITENGKVVAKLIGEAPRKELSAEERVKAFEDIRKLFANVNPNIDLDQIGEERIIERLGIDQDMIPTDKKDALQRFMALFPEGGLDLDPEQVREERLRRKADPNG